MEPRALLTITRSPFLIPSRLASAVPISTKALGTRPASQGMLRLMAPVCQCSETRYVVATIGKTSGLPYLSNSVDCQTWAQGLDWILENGFFTGLSTGSACSGKGPSATSGE